MVRRDRPAKSARVVFSRDRAGADPGVSGTRAAASGDGLERARVSRIACDARAALRWTAALDVDVLPRIARTVPRGDRNGGAVPVEAGQSGRGGNRQLGSDAGANAGGQDALRECDRG